MRCDDVMTREPESVSPDDTVALAAAAMRDENVGFLPVCDQAMRVIGTVTDRDIAIRVVAEHRPPTTPVRDVMSRELVACRPADDLAVAEELMGNHHKSRILCTDEAGRLVGVISLSDIAQAESDERAARTIRHVNEREAPALYYGF
jgi:CBS domain-containing protein